MLDLLRLMISKNPDNEIAAKLIFNRQFDPCESYSENEAMWNNSLGCDNGFHIDNAGKK